MSTLPDYQRYLMLADATRVLADLSTDAEVRRMLDNAVTRYLGLAATMKPEDMPL